MRISAEVITNSIRVPLLLSSIVVGIPDNDMKYINLDFEAAKTKNDIEYCSLIGQYGAPDDLEEVPSWLNYFVNRQGLITTMPSYYDMPDFDMYRYNEYPDGDDGDEDCADQYSEIYSDPDDLRALDEYYDKEFEDFERFKKRCYIESVTFKVDENTCFEDDIDASDFDEDDLGELKIEEAKISLGTIEFTVKASNETKCYLE